MANVQRDLGPVSAYAIAVKHGYKGTEAEWAALQIAAADNAESAAESAKNAADTLASVQETVTQETNGAVETIKARETAAIDAVGAKETASIRAVQEAASVAGAAQEQAITEKGAETLATIPEEYTILTEKVAQNAADILLNAPAIIPAATGEVIAVTDSAERPLAGLTLYGKTVQDGIPTPDAPVDLVNVGNSGSITASTFGKNLLPGITSVKTSNGVTYTPNVDGSISAKGTVSAEYPSECTVGDNLLLPAGTYIMSGGLDNKRKLYTSVDGKFVISEGAEVSFTLSAPTVLKVRCQIEKEITVDATFRPMIRLADTAATYEPYKDGGSVTVSTPNGLPGIPVTSGGNYTDGNGQQWICDEVDFRRGVYVQRCYMETLSPTYDATYDRYKCGLTHPANMACGDGAGIMCLCDKLTYSKTAGAYADERGNGIRVSTTNNKLAVGRYNGNEVGDITIMYPVDTPIETPLSADALSAYHAMTSQYPNTTVINDAGAGVKLSYIADTKNYIDQKIAAIAAAML